MSRAVLVVSLLVACSLVGTAVGDAPALHPSPPSQLSLPAQPGQLDDDRAADIEMLGLAEPTRSDIASGGVDVSTAVSAQRESASSAIDRRALEVAFERAEDEQARRALLFEAATDVEIAIAALRSRQHERREAYVDGTITRRAYVRSRVMADVRAEQLRTDLELIQRYADRVPQLSMRSRIEALQVALTGTGGPVTDRIRATVEGESPPVETYVAVSPNGRALAMVADDEYVREAYRSDVWTPDTTSGIGFDEAVARTNELYPVAFNSSRNLARGMGENGAGTYQISMEVREGDIVTYLDGDTRNVFAEVQRFRLVLLEPGPMVSTDDNGTRLIVNRTYDGGPLRIVALDNATREPIDVPVFVGETRYRTGSDGVVWALDPDGQTHVVAVGEAGNASVTVGSLRPSLVEISPVEE